MEALRDQRGVPWLASSWLDVKLGVRMLRKQWGLTLVGGLAMTVVIGVVAGAFTFLQAVSGHTLPLDDGDRVVAIQTRDAASRRVRTTSVRDVERWRDGVRSLADVGAYQTIELGLTLAEGPAEPVTIAEMTASGFQLARVPPLLGRPLVEEDEREGATPVLVIGYDAWRTRFASDMAVVGRRVRLDDTLHTVVGVMPEDFAFPLNHRFWTPLRALPSDELRDAGRGGVVFARLSPGATLESAQVELTTIGVLPRVEGSETTETLQPRVVFYSAAFFDDYESWEVRLLLFLVSLLLVPPCANIAILVYARTVRRQEEFAARYALGASRGRIVVQIFVEVLVLAAGAASVALALVRVAGAYMQVTIGQQVNGPAPFWMDFSLSFGTVLFVAGLAVFAALIAGVAPALQATGRLLQSGLRSLGSRTGMQLGRTWTALVVAQVAFSLAALPTAVEMAWGTLRSGILGPGFAAEEFLTAQLTMDRGAPSSNEAETDRQPFASRLGSLQTELVRQLEAEPGVLEVTVASSVPGQARVGIVEVDGIPPPDGLLSGLRSGHQVGFHHVDDLFFDVFDVPLLTGRWFDTADFEPEPTAVIVNRNFAQDIAGDQNPLGLRVRYLSRRRGETPPAAESPRWFEIVGVVGNLPAHTDGAKMYHPAAPGQIHPMSLAVRVGPNPAGMATRLREMTSALDPALQIDTLQPLAAVYRQQQRGNNMGAFALAAVTLSVLLLSAAGMYALMSFTVNQRRREIGIRSALGASPRRLLAGIFRRAAGQVGAGALVGVLAALLLGVYLPIQEMGGWHVPGILPGAAAFMIVVGLLAAAGPARRGLRVEPTEALRDG